MTSEPDLKMVGGVTVKNRKGQVVLWFKGKDSEGSSFGLVRYRPDLADDAKMRRDLAIVFIKIKEATLVKPLISQVPVTL